MENCLNLYSFSIFSMSSQPILELSSRFTVSTQTMSEIQRWRNSVGSSVHEIVATSANHRLKENPLLLTSKHDSIVSSGFGGRFLKIHANIQLEREYSEIRIRRPPAMTLPSGAICTTSSAGFILSFTTTGPIESVI